MRTPSFMMLSALVVATACKLPPPGGSAPPARDTARVRPIPPVSQPVVIRDTALEQRAARLELTVLEKEAQLEEMQTRLDDARREVVRAMAKLQSLATRAEAASGMAEAEIALQALRTNGDGVPSSEASQAAQLLQLATGEFDRQNYAGALYLATQSKSAASVGEGRLGSGDRGAPRAGEIPFALPLRVETTSRANVRERPSSGARVLFTLEAGEALVAYSYVDQWVRISAGTDRAGWIHQGLIGRRR